MNLVDVGGFYRSDTPYPACDSTGGVGACAGRVGHVIEMAGKVCEIGAVIRAEGSGDMNWVVITSLVLC